MDFSWQIKIFPFVWGFDEKGSFCILLTVDGQNRFVFSSLQEKRKSHA